MGMEIRTLRYFLAVAREGSITRAANFLHLTQPTLSRQMQDLEQELGRQLLIRKSHRVDLTPEGVLLRKRAEEIVAMVDKTEAEFIALEDTVSGDIYIGSGETRALCPIAGLIRQLREECPGIRYHLHSGNAQDVTDRLDKGLLDFGILIQPADIAKYDALSLPARDVWGVLMRRDSPLAQKDRIERADLMGLPLICSRQVITPPSGGERLCRLVRGGLRKAGYRGQLQPGLQRGPAGGSGGGLCHHPGRAGQHLRGQQSLLPSPLAPAGIGAGHRMEKIPGLFPGGRAVFVPAAGDDRGASTGIKKTGAFGKRLRF